MIECEGLTKRFGHFTAVDHVSFKVKKGSVFGFLRPNGSGKSTVIRLLMRVAPAKRRPGAHRRAGCGARSGADQESDRLHVPEFSLYDELTTHENLNFYARLYGLRGTKLKERYDQL